jgi:hypothetical protein
VADKGLIVATIVRIEDDCPIEYTSTESEVSFALGGYENGFHFMASAKGLEKLLNSCVKALAELRSCD